MVPAREIEKTDIEKTDVEKTIKDKDYLINAERCATTELPKTFKL